MNLTVVVTRGPVGEELFFWLFTTAPACQIDVLYVLCAVISREPVWGSKGSVDVLKLRGAGLKASTETTRLGAEMEMGGGGVRLCGGCSAPDRRDKAWAPAPPSPRDPRAPQAEPFSIVHTGDRLSTALVAAVTLKSSRRSAGCLSCQTPSKKLDFE